MRTRQCGIVEMTRYVIVNATNHPTQHHVSDPIALGTNLGDVFWLSSCRAQWSKTGGGLAMKFRSWSEKASTGEKVENPTFSLISESVETNQVSPNA